MTEEKKPMATLFCDNPETPEGKYLVKRRDGTVVEWPSFVLGARDPIAVVALRAYADEVERIVLEDAEYAAKLGLTLNLAVSIRRRANAFRVYREENGTGDPGMGRHRKDDPKTIEEMRQGRSS